MGLRTLDKLHERLIASFLKWRYRPKTELGLVRWAAQRILGADHDEAAQLIMSQLYAQAEVC